MPTAQTCDALFALIERSGLLSSARTAAYRPPGAEPPNAAVEVARALVRDRLLTPFQARQLIKGKSRGFFLTEKYKVLEPLGEGGMGHVYLCEHLLLHKLVAVKLLHASWVSVPGAEERFLREARAAATVDHPNIVRVFDVDRSAGAPFIVMEFVDGTNLHQLVAGHGPLSPARAAEYVRQTAIGLAAAHKAGLVHRDIKPGNLLLDRSGQVRVLDLGLARFMVDSARNNNLTQKFDPGAVLGTLDFIAPEQADDSSRVDIRSDVYSLGHTLYYLLTGKLPFGEGSAAQKLMWHQVRQPEPLSQVRPEVPPDLSAVFEKMTAKAPAHRFQTPAEVVAALRPFISGVSAPAPEEMPKFRASAFLLGLSPPPKPEMLANVAPPETPKASVAETVQVRRGAGGLVPPPPAPVPADSSSDILNNTHPASNDTQLQIPTPYSTADATPAPRHTMTRSVLIGFATVVLLAVGLVVWKRPAPESNAKPSQHSSTNPDRPDPVPLGKTLTGEGSSFVDPVMQRWAELYREKSGVAIAYAKSGSSQGVREFVSKRVAFGATDAYLTDAQLLDAEAAGGPVLHVPLVMGAVVTTYNLPDVKAPLRFTGAVLADIYLGKITHWDAPALRDSNRGVALPHLPIVVVRRGDGSGTTFIWTDYLSKVSGEWRGGPGAGNVVRWPLGVAADKNDGVAREVKKTVGAIGYVELTYALARNLPAALVENSSGEFVAPDLASVTAAAEGKLKDIPADLRFTLTDAPGKGAYPISGTTWAVLFKRQPVGGKELVAFLRWAVHDGQTEAAEQKYAPLPPELVKRIDAALDGVGSDK